MNTMKPMTQQEFEALVSRQKAHSDTEPPADIAGVDLSSIVFSDRDLDGTTIAMSCFPTMTFDRSYSLHGVTWIGNEISDCIFVGVGMNKCEVLDCVLKRCVLRVVSLFRGDLTGTAFEDCTLEDLDLSQGTCLIRVSFTNCILKNVKINESLTLNETGDFEFDERGHLRVDPGR